MTKKTITKKYQENKAYIKIKGAVINPQNARQVPLDCDCRIDTGFDGGLLIPLWHRKEIEDIDVEPRITNMTVADGTKVPALVCVAHLQEIDSHVLPMPGRDVMLVMCGDRPGVLLGMDTLRHSTILFDGPKQEYTMDP